MGAQSLEGGSGMEDGITTVVQHSACKFRSAGLWTRMLADSWAGLPADALTPADTPSLAPPASGEEGSE